MTSAIRFINEPTTHQLKLSTPTPKAASDKAPAQEVREVSGLQPSDKLSEACSEAGSAKTSLSLWGNDHKLKLVQNEIKKEEEFDTFINGTGRKLFTGSIWLGVDHTMYSGNTSGPFIVKDPWTFEESIELVQDRSFSDLQAMVNFVRAGYILHNSLVTHKSVNLGDAFGIASSVGMGIAEIQAGTAMSLSAKAKIAGIGLAVGAGLSATVDYLNPQRGMTPCERVHDNLKDFIPTQTPNSNSIDNNESLTEGSSDVKSTRHLIKQEIHKRGNISGNILNFEKASSVHAIKHFKLLSDETQAIRQELLKSDFDSPPDEILQAAKDRTLNHEIIFAANEMVMDTLDVNKRNKRIKLILNELKLNNSPIPRDVLIESLKMLNYKMP
jgi:hypothetical protein